MVKTSIGSILLLILPKPKVSMIAAVQHSKRGICLSSERHREAGRPDAGTVPRCPHTSRMTAPQRANAGKPWADADDAALRRLAEMNTPPKLMADQLGRSLVSVLGRATKLGITVPEGKRRRRGLEEGV
jgi:hypothetical protein